MPRLLNDVSRCEGGDCLWKKSCARWVQRLTGRVQSVKLCPGTGPRDEQTNYIPEDRT